MESKPVSTIAAILSIFQLPAQAMGLRSFVALPLDKGGAVLRFQIERNQDTDTDKAIVNLAYGLGSRQALLLGLPYRLSPAGPNRLGDLGVLYRHTVWQDDFAGGTHRIGLLAGLVAPTDNDRDAAIQAGFVSTLYQGRHEWDIDALYQVGLDDRPDSGRYDISWQYRLAPDHYPEWGVGNELNSVLELGGRWTEANEIVHQLTLGLQWIHPRWVLEGGIFQDINGPENTHFLITTRFHY